MATIPKPKPYTDSTIITFGKYKGSALADVPDHWLKWYYGEHKFDKNNLLVDYIFEALDHKYLDE